MTEKQPTSVEWLVNQMKQRENQGLTLSMYELEMFGEQANKMHKEQIIDAFITSRDPYGVSVGNSHSIKKAEQYYKETFKTE